jgi:hypothetical protein
LAHEAVNFDCTEKLTPEAWNTCGRNYYQLKTSRIIPANCSVYSVQYKDVQNGNIPNDIRLFSSNSSTMYNT